MKNSLFSPNETRPGDRRRASLVSLAALVAALVILLIPAGCSSSQLTTTAAGATTAATTAGTTVGSKVFTLAELSQYNGLNGQPAYVAVAGVVYDMTHANAWYNGGHQSHLAGRDLTQELGRSPHGSSMLQGLPIVGTLQG